MRACKSLAVQERSLVRSGADVVVVGEILGQCQINERLRSKWIIGITHRG